MEKIKLAAQVREKTGKGVARKLRQSGLVPAVIYGKGKDPQALVVDPQEVKNYLAGNVIFDLDIEGLGTMPAMIKDIQKDVISGDLKHVDFLHISMDEKVTVSVPVVLVGDAPGVQEGGVIQQLLWELEVECLPLEIPESLEVDVSNLGVGESLSVSNLQVPEGITILTSEEETIVTIAVPTTAAENEESEGEITEPEVIGEDKEETEE
ncbi:MAG: 50S ribosomal protein L25 [Halanaerobiales bacterium]|jgi:large subunit ribosomal protein L25|nr:50S ribosomal protein L25 [Bacillota bacterium]HOA40067.1 50S ribosomal protein L25 [Halanaerobiales bacterium]HPZ62143.1 50S ribosomal protein L25 [Halanaerobiales bacterium]HQD03360.1 50S ribosomal protein L25 [Halanaerobiales bacterium]